MWFVSIIAMLAWSGSDIFSKIGTPTDDKDSHYKVGIAVGAVMGIHALYMVLTGTPFSFSDIITYLPASFFYISSMLIGYIGLRYIELSISSPICNTSGALALVFSLIYFGVAWDQPDADEGIFLNVPIVLALVLIVCGVLSLGFVEYRENDEARLLRQAASGRKYTKSVLAILLPVIYCLLDACGSFVDTLIADKYAAGLLEKNASLTEDAADLLAGDTLNTAYEFTWFFMAVIFAVYLAIRKKWQKPTVKADGARLAGGICETLGQVFYMMVVVSDYKIGLVIISAYCALSLLWGRLLLKEKLSWRHYLSIAAAFAGIVILGFYDV